MTSYHIQYIGCIAMKSQQLNKAFFLKSLFSFIIIVFGVTAGLFLGNFFGFTSKVNSMSFEPEKITQDTNLELHQKFPEVQVDDLLDFQSSLTPLLAGKKTLLCFVSNGCDACIQFVNAISDKSILPDNSYQIILLSPDVEFFKKNYSFSAYQVNWDFLESQHINKFPTIMGIDESRAIKFIHTGYIPQLDIDYLKTYL